MLLYRHLGEREPEGRGESKKDFYRGEIVQQSTHQLCDGLGLVADWAFRVSAFF